MCGIAGIIGGLDEKNRSALRRMAEALRHRGPDGEGFWESSPDASGVGCLLAHRRLSILDLSNAASQPMLDARRKLAIVFNGEIYNYRALRDELTALGEAFESTGDTAVLLRLLGLQGWEALGKLEGMFAFGLWDDGRRELTLARDPLGIKPVYVYRNPVPEGRAGFSLAFASEVRALLASRLIQRPRLSREAVASMVWNGFVVGPGTIVAGIDALRPGEVAVFDSGALQKKAGRVWAMPRGDNEKASGIGAVKSAIEASVARHLIADVPVGVFLSGGIDSSAVANLAQRASDRPIHTFTLAFEDTEFNEAPFARRIADAIESDHTEIVLTESSFTSGIDAAIDSIDQPTFDGINSWYISKAVREAGLSVALVGTGGDELFGGYKSFRELPKLLWLASAAEHIPVSLRRAASQWVARRLRGRGSAIGFQSRWAKLPDMVATGRDLIGLYQLAYALFLPELQAELLSRDQGLIPLTRGLSADLYAWLVEEIATHSPLSSISVLEQRCFLGERLLRDTDAASMASSLEVRLPLVDRGLLEHVNGLPDGLRYAPVGRKALLRQIGLDGLDPKLFDRPKSGFVLPFERWMRGSLGDAVGDVMNDAAAATAVGLVPSVVARLWAAFQGGHEGLYWSRVWAIYVLIRWCHRHGVLL